MHQLTMLLSSRRRRAEKQATVAVAKEAAEEPKIVLPRDQDPPQRCLNESAHKLYQ